jgi:hypothetical protein
MKGRIKGRWAAWVLVLAVASACGGNDPVTVDPAVAPFVGTWDAAVLTMRPEGDTDPTHFVDVLGLGADFYITVEPSGHYTATLAILGNPAELGQLTVIDATTLRLDPSYPASAKPATASYVDGTNDPAEAHFELQRR